MDVMGMMTHGRAGMMPAKRRPVHPVQNAITDELRVTVHAFRERDAM